MPRRSSGTLWLVLGLISGLVTVLVLAFGSFAVMHTHNNVRLHENIVDRRMQELEQLRPNLHLPGNQARAEQLMRMVEFDLGNLRQYKSTRNLAFLIAGSSLVPGALTVVFLAVYAVKRVRAGGPVPSESPGSSGAPSRRIRPTR